MDEKLKEGEDYVIENGYWVFTREYLLKRGSCCESGCKNCPYGVKIHDESHTKVCEES